MKNELKNLKKTIRSTNALPILECALIKNGRIYASDLENTVSYPTDIQGDGAVDMNTLIGANFDSAKIENGHLVMKRGNGISKLSCQDADDYPAIPETPIKLGKITEIQALKTLLPFTSKDELRPVMNGIFLGDGLACATDAHQLIFVKRPKTNVKEVILLKKAVTLLDEDEYTVYTNEARNYLRFAGQRQELITRLIDGKFPNFPAVIPKTCNAIAWVNPKDLLTAVTNALPFANKTVNAIKFSFSDNGLSISAEDIDLALEFKTSIEAKNTFPGKKFTTGFNGKLLINILKAMKGQEKIPVYMSHCDRGAIFGENFLLMPLLINGKNGDRDPDLGWYERDFPGDQYGTPGEKLPSFIYEADKPIKSDSETGKNLETPAPVIETQTPETETPAPVIETETSETETKAPIKSDSETGKNSETPAPVIETQTPPDIFIIEYSEKGIAVVGNIEHLREKLIAAYGSPKIFVYQGSRFAGIAFSKKRKAAVIEIINQQ